MQVDAFTTVPFGGNPAAVVLVPPLTKLDDAIRQQIAMEMNLAETAFLEPLTDAGEPCAASETPLFRSASRFRLRWFTPLQESELCGHATLASAAALVQGAVGSNAVFSNSNAAVGHSHTALADQRVEADAVGHKVWNVQCVQCGSMQRSYVHVQGRATPRTNRCSLTPFTVGSCLSSGSAARRSHCCSWACRGGHQSTGHPPASLPRAP
jgi:Phenazine biosynthesis-like protein